MQLQTERLLIREIVDRDWTYIHRYTTLPEVTMYTAWGPNTEQDTKSYVQAVLRMQQQQPRTEYELAICLKEQGMLIGGIGLHLTEQTNAELGYVLHPAYQGNGYVTEACMAVIEAGFQQLGVHRIYAKCRPHNSASAKVMQRIGMQHEGLLREHWFYKGAYHDSLLYSILASEYEQLA
ncbi:GNAT family protein [Paenibacillus campi]|uniref:GNAT family N-acetyltransferase n=1 Tax=Paenibacillus campi TaxID=3106031 RepID=UPI002AFE895E|nr:GNAT family protein [Paenibacillus sp. SGZ-1009]